jgi:hypothetical protein
MKRSMPLDQKRTFAVLLEPEEEGGFTVRVPSIPEIVTYGKDEGEALAMAEDASAWCSRTVPRAASLFLCNAGLAICFF